MRSARYGTVREWVLGLEVVLPTGELVFVGCRTLKCRQGYNLVSLFVGSEGIITKAVLKIWPLPEAVVRVRAFFNSPEDAVASVARLKSRGLRPLILEFLDKETMDAVQSYVQEFRYPSGAEAMLIMDIDGPGEALSRFVDSVGEILRAGGCIELDHSSDPEEMERLYLARRAAYPALLRSRDVVVYPEDFSVPPSRLVEAYRGYVGICRRYGISCPTWGHVGDGNLHPNLLVERGNEEMRRRAMEAIREMGMLTIRLGGTVSSEHGIGVIKRELLLEELRSLGSEKLIEIMRGIKGLLDPNGIMNPGKIV
jgi:glycolate oxidase